MLLSHRTGNGRKISVSDAPAPARGTNDPTNTLVTGDDGSVWLVTPGPRFFRKVTQSLTAWRTRGITRSKGETEMPAEQALARPPIRAAAIAIAAAVRPDGATPVRAAFLAG
jgi:hypothetical protein